MGLDGALVFAQSFCDFIDLELIHEAEYEYLSLDPGKRLGEVPDFAPEFLSQEGLLA